MTDSYIATPSKTKQILSQYNFTFKKSLGQNFIIDTNILKRMIEESGINESAGIIEVGPGIGSLTEQLALHTNRVVAIEIDERLKPILKNTLGKYDNIKLYFKDILKTDLHELIKENFSTNQVIHVVANLPYYITTPILFKLLEDRLPIDSITIMLQKEVAERMSAKPGTKAYNSLSIAVQYYTKAQIIMDVPPTVFMPQPHVTSSVLNLKLRKQPAVSVDDEAKFFSIVKASFQQRRKTLRNNLRAYFKKQYTTEQLDLIFEAANIDSSRRGESLTLQEFANLTNAFLHN